MKNVCKKCASSLKNKTRVTHCDLSAVSHFLYSLKLLTESSSCLSLGAEIYTGKVSDRIFSVCQRIQTGSGTYPASYPMGTGGFYPRGKVAGA
jgi:hypothetical protein